MKIARIAELGHYNISAHKTRSIATALTISLLFTTLLSFNFIIQGIGNLAISYLKQIGGDEVTMSIKLCRNDNERKCPSQDEAVREVSEKSKKYGGEYIGDIEVYRSEQGEKIAVIDRKNVQYFIKNNQLANDKIQAVIPHGSDNAFAKTNIEIVGETPSKTIDLHTSRRSDEGALISDYNGLIDGSKYDLYAINNQGEQIQNFLKETGTKKEDTLPLVRFKDDKKAYKFYKKFDCNYNNFANKCSNFYAEEIFSGTVVVHENMDSIFEEHKVTGIIIVVIAFVISLLTLSRTLVQERRNIALYQSLGASYYDVFWIYMSYMVELCLISILITTVASAIIAVAYCSGHVKYIADSIGNAIGYQLDNRILNVFGGNYLKIVCVMLLSGPCVSLFTSPILSSKSLVKNIKES